MREVPGAGGRPTLRSMLPFPPAPPFVVPTREEVTLEPEPDPHHTSPLQQDLDWIGSAQQGGGSVPEDFEWRSNPKEWQEGLSSG